MSFLQKLQTFVARCGTPAKFVAKTVVGYAVPGSEGIRVWLRKDSRVSDE